MLCVMCYVISGCSDQNLLENMSLTLILGLDLDKQDRLQVYVVSPVFTKEAKVKEEVTHIKSWTLRNSREKLDEQVMGKIVGSKTQLILVGNRLLHKKHWGRYLDSLYRDPKNSVNARVIGVDGSVAKILHYHSKNKPRLSVYLTKLLDTAHQRNNTVNITLQNLKSQTFEKGITPSIARIKQFNIPQIQGAMLLDSDQRKSLFISSLETKLLNILKNKHNGDLSLPCSLSSKSLYSMENSVHVSIQNMHTNTKVYYNNNFHFKIVLSCRVMITEFSPSFSMKKNPAFLKKEIEHAIEKQLYAFIQKIQQNKLDPIGYGVYARAYEYPQWEKVGEHWEDAFAKSKIKIKAHVKIIGMGPTQA